LREDGDRGDEETTVADADEDGLGQDCLPVFFAETGHHETKGYQNTTGEDEMAEVAGVI
jgi:hypothetical protein